MGNKRRIPEFFVELFSGRNQSIFQPVPQLGSNFGKEYKFTQALWFDGLQTRLPVTYSEIPFEMAQTIQRKSPLFKCGLERRINQSKNLLKEAATSGWAQSLETPMQLRYPNRTCSIRCNRLTERGLGERCDRKLQSVSLEASAQTTFCWRFA